MQALMIKMAKEAAENDTLIACTIQSYCQKNMVTWTDVAEQLKISEEQLAKLALCRRPTPQNFSDDIAQIANYTKIEVDQLNEFLASPSFSRSLKRRWLPKRPSTHEQGATPIMKRRAVTFAIALIAVLIVSAFLFSQPDQATATLTVFTGEAVITQTAPFGRTTDTAVTAGDSITLATEDRIVMSANSTAELILFEGSRVDLSENTTLELTELAAAESDHQIYMTLLSGRIVNQVTKLLGVDDAYEVRTPSSTASVRGTVFSVAVVNNNTTEVQVAEGIVAVMLGDATIEVGAGEMVTAVTGQPLQVETTNNAELLPTATPGPRPTEASGETEEDVEAKATEEVEETVEAETVERSAEATVTEEPEETLAAGATEEATGTPVGVTTTPKPSKTTAPGTTVPATNTAVSPISPTSTTDSPLSTNTPVTTLPTNTPVPPPTNTPLPPPTNTAVPVVPTNTPLPPPTNTPEPPPPTEEPALVTICHNPGPNQQTKQVPQSAVQGHLDHGDYLGACN